MQTLEVLERRLRAAPGHTFPDVQAACKAVDAAQASWHEADRHQEDLWAQEKEGQLLQIQHTCMRKPLEQNIKDMEVVQVVPCIK